VRRPARAAEPLAQPVVEARVGVVARDVPQALRQRCERRRVRRTPGGDRLTGALDEPLAAPPFARDADHRDVEPPGLRHRLEARQDFPERKIPGDAE
jgi:hypothetical protein